MIPTITLQRHGQNDWNETTLPNGVYISIRNYQNKGQVIAEIYKQDEVNISEVFKTRTGAKLYLEEYNNIKISDQVEAYIINAHEKNIDDIYYAAAVWCEYSQTFRTPKENYLIATINEDGTLDFGWCDGQLKEKIKLIPNIKQLQNQAIWTHNRPEKDHTWTAWLLSQYMKESGKFTTIKTTVEKFQKNSVNSL